MNVTFEVVEMVVACAAQSSWLGDRLVMCRVHWAAGGDELSFAGDNPILFEDALARRGHCRAGAAPRRYLPRLHLM